MLDGARIGILRRRRAARREESLSGRIRNQMKMKVGKRSHHSFVALLLTAVRNG